MKRLSQGQSGTQEPSTEPSLASSNTQPHGSTALVGLTKKRRQQVTLPHRDPENDAARIMPSMTPRLRSLMEMQATPTLADGQDLLHLEKAIVILLWPIDQPRLIGKITVCLSHYYMPDLPAPVAEGVIRDWVADLEEFPEMAVDESFQAWRRSESRRPTISDIRRRCQDYVRPTRKTLARVMAQISKIEWNDDDGPVTSWTDEQYQIVGKYEDYTKQSLALSGARKIGEAMGLAV